LIKESKSDKQKYKKTLDKFNNLLHGAGATFLENWNINLNPKKIKEMKFN
jgi:predicted SprT family Zn-dependent metalloprotease